MSLVGTLRTVFWWDIRCSPLGRCVPLASEEARRSRRRHIGSTAFDQGTSVGGFWRFVAIHIVIVVVLTVLGTVATAFVVLEGVYLLALLIPSLAIAVRRPEPIRTGVRRLTAARFPAWKTRFGAPSHLTGLAGSEPAVGDPTRLVHWAERATVR